MGRLLSRPGRDFSAWASKPAEARVPCPNTGEAYAGDQTITRGIRGIVAINLANIFAAVPIADELRQAVDQLGAICRNEPSVRLQQPVHELPAADSIIIGGRWMRQAIGDEHVAELLRHGCFGGAVPQSSRRQEHFA